jgi:hypothetical protein
MCFIASHHRYCTWWLLKLDSPKVKVLSKCTKNRFANIRLYEMRKFISFFQFARHCPCIWDLSSRKLIVHIWTFRRRRVGWSLLFWRNWSRRPPTHANWNIYLSSCNGYLCCSNIYNKDDTSFLCIFHRPCNRCLNTAVNISFKLVYSSTVVWCTKVKFVYGEQLCI